MTEWIHGHAGDLRTTETRGRAYVNAKIVCGRCGEQHATRIDVRARPYAIECPSCGGLVCVRLP